MKFSEALKKGIPLSEQGFSRLLCVDGKTCAIGTALQGLGYTLTLPETFGDEVTCLVDGIKKPAYKVFHDNFPGFSVIDIFNMNDGQRLTREQIVEEYQARGQ